MVSALFSVLKGNIGIGLFLLASVLSFISLYFILMGGRSDNYKRLKYAVVIVSIFLTDVVWMANRFLDPLHFGNYTVAEKLFVDFTCAGDLCFIAVAFISLFSAKKGLRVRIVSWCILVISSVWSFLNRLLSSAGKEPLCIWGMREFEPALVLSIVIVLSIVVLGCISTKFDGLTSSQKALSKGLGVIISAVAVMCVVLTIRDMKVLMSFSQRLQEFLSSV